MNDVLARDEALVDVFVRHSEHFTKLRNRTMRRVMGRLVTVEDAARIAAVPVDALVRDLNEALGIMTPVAEPAPSTHAPNRPTAPRPVDGRVVELDVRDELRQGREPFARIMSAVAALVDGEALRVRAIFHPVPLLSVLARRGYASESEQHAPDDWSVWFWRVSTTEAGTPPGGRDAPLAASRTSESPPMSAPVADDHTVVLDVRGLQPPDPLVRTLAALETLPAGHQLIQLNERVPQLLLPMLAERGFACELDESRADRVLLRVWRPA